VFTTENITFIAPFFEVEIQIIRFSMNSNKAPRPDEFSILLYQKILAPS
jgi:hypothetical protein